MTPLEQLFALEIDFLAAFVFLPPQGENNVIGTTEPQSGDTHHPHLGAGR
jgi:hypothetical protein